MARVLLKNLGKRYSNGHLALTDINLDIAEGELLTVVGPSGCGKSTLLRLIAGLEAPSHGQILLDGTVAEGLSPQQRNVAMVFQDYALYPNMRVRGNLEFPLRMRKLTHTEIARKVDEVAALLELGPLLNRLPRELSGGQRQRVAMGRALVRDPSVFLLDEPLSNLDAKLRGQVRSEIAEMQRRLGTTMIYVTHDQIEAITLGHRIAILDGGHLQQVATPRVIYEDPANPFVAGFIGNPPMNLFQTALVFTEGRPGIRIGTLSIAATMAGVITDGVALTEQMPVTAGIRPESIHPADDGDPSAFTAEIETVEYLGHETLLHLRTCGAQRLRLLARISGTKESAVGSIGRFRVDPGAMRLFVD